jgi:opacity protein-like surface antigen
MRCQRPFVIATLVLSALVLAPVLAFSETFVDLYAGGAFPMDTHTTFNGTEAASKSPYKDSFVFGGRVGYYFEGVPWVGLALDASYFKADINLPNGAENDVIPVSALLMVRAPLNVTTDFPHGRVQPYLGIGPSFVYSKADVESDDDTSFNMGFDVHLGLNYMFTRNIGIFGEYRFTYVKPSYELNGTTVEPNFSVNHFAVGLAFRF